MLFPSTALPASGSKGMISAGWHPCHFLTMQMYKIKFNPSMIN